MPSGTDHKTPVGNAYRGFFCLKSSEQKMSQNKKRSQKAIKDSNK